MFDTPQALGFCSGMTPYISNKVEGFITELQQVLTSYVYTFFPLSVYNQIPISLYSSSP